MERPDTRVCCADLERHDACVSVNLDDEDGLSAQVRDLANVNAQLVSITSIKSGIHASVSSPLWRVLMSVLFTFSKNAPKRYKLSLKYYEMKICFYPTS